MKPYIVRQGDYLTQIAFRDGFDADVVWNHEKNAGLRNAGRTPDMLATGDVLFVPDREAPGRRAEVGGANPFRTTIPKVRVKLCLTLHAEALEGVEYVARAGSVPNEGVTGPGGLIEFEVPVSIRECLLQIPREGIDLVLALGSIEPHSETGGVATRLNCLGYLPRGVYRDDAALQQAIRNFQRAQGLDVTGEADDATRKALVMTHGI